MKARFSDGTLKTLNVATESGSSSQSRSKRLVILFGTLAGLFAISTAALAVTLVLRSRATEKNVNNDLCITPYCVKAANYLIESIDETVEPCEDFYQFVCGTWIKTSRIPDDADAINTFNILRTQLDYNVVDILTPTPSPETNEPKAITNARILYHSCINEENIENEGVNSILLLVYNEFGGWPIIQGSSWDNSTYDLLNILLKLRKYNNDIIFGIGTSVDEKNSQKYDIAIGQSDLGLGQPQYYFNETKNAIAYRQFMHDLALEITNDVQLVENDVNEIFAFEKELAKHYWTTEERRGRPNATIRTTVGNLRELLNTTFNFTRYLRSAYSWGGIDLEDEDIVTVHEFEYLNNVSSIVDQTSPRILQNYIIWRFIMHRVDNMPKRFRSIKENFLHIIRGTTADQSRKIICGNYVNGNMGFAVSKLYIKNYFDDTARNQSVEMIGNIRKAFINMVDKSTWMDQTSRQKAIEKAEAIDEKIGYPDYLASDNVTELETKYAQIKAKEDFQILRNTVDRKAWGLTAPTVVNAFYSPSKNQITFPAGILQMPFFDKDAPKYLNYGGIGVVFGHEITHGFDNSGRQFDKDGNRIPWWTKETIEEFNNRKKCIVEQYSNFTVPNINIKANGNQTQGEDIADNGGLRESFFAYQKWSQANPNADKKLPGLSKYTPEQMFFINYAHTWCSKMTDSYALNRVLSDVHSLGQFRVIGPTSNFVEFDRAFKCQPGQGNSRVKKCIVW